MAEGFGPKKLQIIFVDEHNSTKMCSTCNQCVTLYSNRTAHCNACYTSWNRDVNDERNILNLGLAVIEKIDQTTFPNASVVPALKSLKPWNSSARSNESTEGNKVNFNFCYDIFTIF